MGEVVKMGLRLDVEITRKCKFKCKVCSVRASPNIDYNEIEIEVLKRKIDEFSKMGGSEISITGGEPSERGIDFLVELIKFSKNLNLKMRMYCVGYGFQNFEDVRRIKEAGLDSVIITLTGPTEIDEQYKGVKGSYRIAINAIELFRKNKIQVIIHFTPTKLTYMHLPHVIDTAYQLGVEKIRIMSFVPQGRGWENRHIFEMNSSEKETFNEILREIKSKRGVDLQFSGIFDVDEAGQSSCMIAKNRFVITSDGLLIPTFAVRMDKEKNQPSQQFILGNVQNTMLSNAWNSYLLTSARICSCGVCDHCKK